MAKRSGTKKTARKRVRPVQWLLRWVARLAVLAVILVLALVGLVSVANPPMTPYMMSERSRLGAIDHDWTPMEEIAPVMARAAVAAEDANFCLHWGFDLDAIQAALESGAARGASTITQQTVKNVYLWQGRSWLRKAMEAGLTPVVEAVWSKRRILELYLNVAEFDEGVFGVGSAARHYFGVSAAELSPTQAARLAAVLPNPKDRSASQPSGAVRARADSIAGGAETIRVDGRADCFEAAG